MNGQYILDPDTAERPPIVLRPYQGEPVQKGIAFLQDKQTPGLIVAPTAAGKSLIIAKIVEGLGGNTLVLQPSKELLAQNYEKFRLTGRVASIYSASFNSRYISPVTYATIGSIKDLGTRFRIKGFDKLIIDEVHAYPRSEGMLGQFLHESGIESVLGLTATPLKLQSNIDRNGNRFSKLAMLTAKSKMGNFFKHILHVTQIQEMTAGGYWSKLVYENHGFDDSMLHFNTTKADYTDESLKRAYDYNATAKKICARLEQLPDRRSVLIFVPSVADAIDLAAKIPGARAVYSGMKDADRDVAVEGFKQYRIRVIVNVNVLATGFDHPGVDLIFSARPTASLAWLYQAWGRGTRIHPEKKDCLIVDYAGNLDKFGRLEELRYINDRGFWKLVGEGGRQLTGIPLHEVGRHTVVEQPVAGKVLLMPFGKYKGRPLHELPRAYRKWMLNEFTWDERNADLKAALLAMG